LGSGLEQAKEAVSGNFLRDDLPALAELGDFPLSVQGLAQKRL